jgi:catechol 2,3-dioxygenase-like lactoylglutathione lyase family enzyme
MPRQNGSYVTRVVAIEQLSQLLFQRTRASEDGRVAITHPSFQSSKPKHELLREGLRTTRQRMYCASVGFACQLGLRINSCEMRYALVLTIFAAAAVAMSHQLSSPLLGSGHGVDHVGIAVRDLAAAKNIYQQLGFLVDPGGKLPDGKKDLIVNFADDTYLELITVYDRQKASKAEGSAWFARWLERHEGSAFLGLDVSSAAQTAEQLRGIRVDIAGPTRETANSLPGIGEPAPGWWMVRLKEQPPGGRIFFIEWEPWKDFVAQHPSLLPHTEHPNGARKLLAAWMSVRDLDAAAKAYEQLGFSPQPPVPAKALGAMARLIPAGTGYIILLAPADKDGVVATSLADRGEGVMGISVAVDDMPRIRSLLAQRLHQHFSEYSGVLGRSFLVPPKYTKGAWIEFVK